jgi:hypothetical protein
MCWQQRTPPHRHYIQKMNIAIKFFEINLTLAINSLKKIGHFSFYIYLKIVRYFCRTLYIHIYIYIYIYLLVLINCTRQTADT